MEIRIVIFLAFVSVAVITNTLLVIFVYRAIARITSNVTAAVSEYGASTGVRRWIDSLAAASQRAAAITESTKVKMADFNAVLEQGQGDFQGTLAAIDAKVGKTIDAIDTTSQKMRDIAARPGSLLSTFAAGLAGIFSDFGD
jgi:hypothetical protein